MQILERHGGCIGQAQKLRKDFGGGDIVWVREIEHAYFFVQKSF